MKSAASPLGVVVGDERPGGQLGEGDGRDQSVRVQQLGEIVSKELVDVFPKCDRVDGRDVPPALE